MDLARHYPNARLMLAESSDHLVRFSGKEWFGAPAKHRKPPMWGFPTVPLSSYGTRTVAIAVSHSRSINFLLLQEEKHAIAARNGVNLVIRCSAGNSLGNSSLTFGARWQADPRVPKTCLREFVSLTLCSRSRDCRAHGQSCPGCTQTTSWLTTATRYLCSGGFKLNNSLFPWRLTESNTSEEVDCPRDMMSSWSVPMYQDLQLPASIPQVGRLSEQVRKYVPGCLNLALPTPHHD